MNYTAKEADVKETVDDFIKFCDYIELENPLATAKGDLSSKACYEVNTLLLYRENDTKPSDRIFRYPSVFLWFSIAKESGLIVLESIKGGKSKYITTEKYEIFKSLNVFSQYLIIFHVWYCFTDIRAVYNNTYQDRSLIEKIDGVFAQFAGNGPDKWIKHKKDDELIKYYTKGKVIQYMTMFYYKTVCDLRNLGFVDFEESAELNKWYNWPVVSRSKPTPLGVIMSKACAKRSFQNYNKYVPLYYMNIDDLTASGEMVDEDGTLPQFVTPFLSCFPPHSIDTQTADDIIFGEEVCFFEFKVSLSKTCYRVIRCLPEHTFEALHLAIQKAFNFDDDHMYSFYLDGKRYSNLSINSPYSNEPPYANDVQLGDERLKNKQKILYLFDYGDCWEFEIVLEKKYETTGELIKPEIIKSVGESPDQYHNYDDDDDFYEDDEME
jgi:hypothetical protein